MSVDVAEGEAGALTPARRYRAYPTYKPSGVEWLGDIPEEWGRAPLKYMALEATSLFLDGDWIESKDISEDGIKYITTGNVGEGFYKEQGVGFISERTFKKLSATEVFEGDILISRLNAPIGRACVVPDLDSRVVTSVDNVIFRPDSKFHRKFVVYMLSSKEYFTHTSNMARGATMQRISRGLLGNIRLIFPTLPEQTQTAAFLDYETAKIDALIDKQERLIALLEEKRQAVISHAVTKGLDPTAPLRPSGIDWLGDVPAHWEVKKGKHVLEMVTSGSRGWAEYYSDEGFLFFRITNLTRDTIRPKMESIQNVMPPRGAEGERSQIQLGDLLVSITADLGSVCVADDRILDGYVSQHVALCRPNEQVGSSDWLAYCVLSDSCKSQLLESGYGGTKIQLSLPDIRELNIALPPVAEQQAIAQYLNVKIDRFFDGLVAGQKQISLLKERRTALISAAVTGKIDLRDWRAPASPDDTRQDTDI